MGKFMVATFLLFVNLATLILPSLACPYCSTPAPPPPHPPPPPSTTPCPPPPSPPTITPRPPPPPKRTPSPPPPTYTTPSPPPPKTTPSTPPPPTYVTPSSPPPPTYTPPTTVPCPPPPKAPRTCPIDTLKLDACVDLLGGLVHIIIGQDVTYQCCPVLQGLADLDAALCLCTTIKAKALGITLLLPIALEVLADCGKHVPSDYQCPGN